jgi:hypothetical protein
MILSVFPSLNIYMQPIKIEKENFFPFVFIHTAIWRVFMNIDRFSILISLEFFYVFLCFTTWLMPQRTQENFCCSFTSLDFISGKTCRKVFQEIWCMKCWKVMKISCLSLYFRYRVFCGFLSSVSGNLFLITAHSEFFSQGATNRRKGEFSLFKLFRVTRMFSWRKSRPILS